MRAYRLLKRFKYQCENPRELEQALVHSSYGNEHGVPDNERLEFLGDAVLGLIVAEVLFDGGVADEGAMSRQRSALVCQQTLARIGRFLGVDDAIFLSKGSERGDLRDQDSVIADTVEALIGAAFLQSGMSQTRRLVVRMYEHVFGDMLSIAATVNKDSKTLFQETAQAVLKATPRYDTREIAQYLHDDMKFQSVAIVGNRTYGVGWGSSKKAAEAEAARMSLEELDQASGEGRRTRRSR